MIKDKIEFIAPSGMGAARRARALANPMSWVQEVKYDKQRIDRGWSDRDTWGAGEYIMKITAGILHALNEKSNPIDWDAYWETNYPSIKKYGYKNLDDVANALDIWLDFQCNETWVDKLPFELGGTRTPEQEKQIEKAIKEHNKIERRLYKDAQKAMKFVAENIGALWW